MPACEAEEGVACPATLSCVDSSVRKRANTKGTKEESGFQSAAVRVRSRTLPECIGKVPARDMRLSGSDEPLQQNIRGKYSSLIAGISWSTREAAVIWRDRKKIVAKVD